MWFGQRSWHEKPARHVSQSQNVQQRLGTGTSFPKQNFKDGVPNVERLNLNFGLKMGKSEVEKPPSSSKTKKERLLFPTKVFSLEFF